MDVCHILRVDLMQLVEEAIDGGWIGHLARMSAQNSEIGSVYSPPTMHQHSAEVSQLASKDYVETIIEIGYREKVCSDAPMFIHTNDLIGCV
jgi:hypothetical protein